ncbi:MAG: Hsp20/alpha crystallin family protein [Anaerolineae bacterium]|nr:Hsp20/alpha crystallin family protein [Anaerolineae bacterium]
MANITRYNPFRDLVSMQGTLDKFFEDAWRQWPDLRTGENALALDVDETDDHFVVTTDLPGVNPEHINVTVHDDVLTINAEMPEETTEHKEGRSLIRERRYGRFSRSIRLPQPVESGKVEADYKDGMLKLTLPKAEDTKVRTIPVKVGNHK